MPDPQAAVRRTVKAMRRDHAAWVDNKGDGSMTLHQINALPTREIVHLLAGQCARLTGRTFPPGRLDLMADFYDACEAAERLPCGDELIRAALLARVDTLHLQDLVDEVKGFTR